MLSTTEAKYLVFSQLLQYYITIMLILKVMKSKGIKTIPDSQNLYCKLFEDNFGTLELTRAPKLRPQTNHINVIYHQFRSYVIDKSISILPIDIFNQIADIFIKPLKQNEFLCHQKKLLK